MDNIKYNKFDLLDWKRRMAILIKENPEIRKLTGHLTLHTNQGNLCEIIVEKKI